MVEAIRSYHARRGRLSVNQREALETLSPLLDLAHSPDPLDLDEVFGRQAPRTLEIGSGVGDTAIGLASTNPDCDYIAADVHTKGIARTLMLIEKAGLTNLRVLHADALDFLTRRLGPGTLHEILVFFPDPWPKARHNKRRLVRQQFVDEVVRVLDIGGSVHLATDDREYALAMREVLADEPRLQKVHDGARLAARPRTKYELAGERGGRRAIDLLYALKAPSQS